MKDIEYFGRNSYDIVTIEEILKTGVYGSLYSADIYVCESPQHIITFYDYEELE